MTTDRFTSEPLNILHVSDFHFGWDGNDVRRRSERDLALKGLIRAIHDIETDWKPEALCITGDIGWKGQPTDYEEARRWLTELLNLTAVPSEAIFACPGNHDLDRNLGRLNVRPSSSASADDILLFPPTTAFQNPFQAYADFMRDLQVPPYSLGDDASFLVGRRAYRGINFVA